MKEKILIIDDEPGIRETLGAVLSDEGFAVETADSGEFGLESARRQDFGCILLDIWRGRLGNKLCGSQFDRRSWEHSISSKSLSALTARSSP